MILPGYAKAAALLSIYTMMVTWTVIIAYKAEAIRRYQDEWVAARALLNSTRPPEDRILCADVFNQQMGVKQLNGRMSWAMSKAIEGNPYISTGVREVAGQVQDMDAMIAVTASLFTLECTKTPDSNIIDAMSTAMFKVIQMHEKASAAK